jgi:hypothetical protein
MNKITQCVVVGDKYIKKERNTYNMINKDKKSRKNTDIQ